jgi:hypothetical protein
MDAMQYDIGLLASVASARSQQILFKQSIRTEEVLPLIILRTIKLKKLRSDSHLFMLHSGSSSVK